MDVAITGASGLIGTALSARLQASGHRVVPLVRRPVGSGEDAVRWDPAAGTIDAAALDGVDAVVNLAGAGIGDKRWTDDRRRELIESRTKSTALLSETLTKLDRPPSVLLNGSAMGYYGDRGDAVVTEATGSGDDFLARMCQAWEAAARPATDAGIRTAFLRTGIVLSPEGGALGPLRRIFGVGLGGKLGGGRQWWSWITLTDEVRAIEFLLGHDVSGPVNLTSPEPVPFTSFAQSLGRALHRPAVLPIPKLGPRLILGRELADTLLFTSIRMEPQVLAAQGFAFEHPELEGALRSVLD